MCQNVNMCRGPHLAVWLKLQQQKTRRTPPSTHPTACARRAESVLSVCDAIWSINMIQLSKRDYNRIFESMFPSHYSLCFPCKCRSCDKCNTKRIRWSSQKIDTSWLSAYVPIRKYEPYEWCGAPCARRLASTSRARSWVATPEDSENVIPERLQNEYSLKDSETITVLKN